MALIPCPACSKEISEMAATCPSCGNPNTQIQEGLRPPVQTIEQTSKMYKGGQLLGGLLILIGAVAAFGGSRSAALFAALAMTIGSIIYLVSKLGAWWNNG